MGRASLRAEEGWLSTYADALGWNIRLVVAHLGLAWPYGKQKGVIVEKELRAKEIYKI